MVNIKWMSWMGNSGQNGTEYKSGGQNRDLQRQSLLNVVGLA